MGFVFKPYGLGSWFRFARKENPDTRTRKFEFSQGEFAPTYEIAFEKYLKKIYDFKEEKLCQQLKRPMIAR